MTTSSHNGLATLLRHWPARKRINFGHFHVICYFGLFFDFNWLLVCGLWAGMHRDRKTMKAQNSQS